jgi:hypothetical protein
MQVLPFRVATHAVYQSGGLRGNGLDQFYFFPGKRVLAFVNGIS